MSAILYDWSSLYPWPKAGPIPPEREPEETPESAAVEAYDYWLTTRMG